MRVHANVFLSISSHCAQIEEGESIALSLFGTHGIVTECLRLSTNSDNNDTQINEHHELFRAVSPQIEFCGIALVNMGTDPAQLKTGPAHNLLLINFSDENTSAQAFHYQHNEWRKTEIQLERDAASAIAINDALVASGSHDILRAKVLLRDKIRHLQTELDTDNAGEIIQKYGQLKKMAIFRPPTELKRSRAENLELITQVIAKSDARMNAK